MSSKATALAQTINAASQSPTFSLDGGLIFERDQGAVVQTLEPRAFYLVAPYRPQDDLPAFDTANTTFSYAQLFRDSRFSGG
jgi:LPS-assembly protein